MSLPTSTDTWLLLTQVCEGRFPLADFSQEAGHFHVTVREVSFTG
jgi:hypothetical protein